MIFLVGMTKRLGHASLNINKILLREKKVDFPIMQFNDIAALSLVHVNLL